MRFFDGLKQNIIERQTYYNKQDTATAVETFFALSEIVGSKEIFRRTRCARGHASVVAEQGVRFFDTARRLAQNYRTAIKPLLLVLVAGRRGLDLSIKKIFEKVDKIC